MIRTNEYALGDEVIVEVRFYSVDEDGEQDELVDPTASTSSIRWRHETGDPESRLLNDEDVTHVGTGIYTVAIVGDAVGKWHYRGESTSGLVAASKPDPGYFTVVGDPTR